MQTIKKHVIKLSLGLGLLAISLLVSAWTHRQANALAPTDETAVAADWSDIVPLSAAPHGETPRIAKAPNGSFMVTYVQEENNIDKPYYRTMSAGGTSWSAPLPIWNANSNVDLPVLAFDNSNRAHAVWIQQDTGRVLYSRQDGWPSTATQLSGATVDDATFPAIATFGNTIHVVWVQGNTFELFYTTSTDAGANWSTPVKLNTGAGEVEYPFLLTDASGNLYTLWQNFDNSTYRIFSNRKPAGEAWTNVNTVILALTIDATYPTAVPLGDDILVTFVERKTVGNVVEYSPHYVRLRNGVTPTAPQSFGQTVYINTLSPFYVSATSANCDDKVYFYYHGGLTTGAPEQILGYTFNGSSWSDADQATDTTGTRLNVYPSLACGPNVLHLLYQEVINNAPRVSYVHREDASNLILP